MATQISNASTTCAENLVSVNNGKIVTTSLQVAEVFNKLHRHVLRDIRNLECSSNFQESNFGLSFYHSKLLNGGYKKQPMYYITRDGFTFLAMGFTGKIAARFKEAYINAFNEMERKLSGITVREDEIINIIRELCADVNSRIKGHEKVLKKEHGVQQAGDMSGLSLLRRGTIKEQLTNIFAVLNNNIMSGDASKEAVELAKKHYDSLKKLVNKIIK